MSNNKRKTKFSTITLQCFFFQSLLRALSLIISRKIRIISLFESDLIDFINEFDILKLACELSTRNRAHKYNHLMMKSILKHFSLTMILILSSSRDDFSFFKISFSSCFLNFAMRFLSEAFFYWLKDLRILSLYVRHRQKYSQNLFTHSWIRLTTFLFL